MATDPISQTIDLSKTQIFHVRAQLDTIYEPERAGQKLEWMNPVPVYGLHYRSREDRLGFAMMSVEGNRVLVDLFLRRDCPERFDIETGQRRYWIRPEMVLRSGFVPALLLMDVNQEKNSPAVGDPVL